MYDVNLFLGIAAAAEGNELDYLPGERHAFLVFSRQPRGSEPDWDLAESHVLNARWCDVELRQASTLDSSAADEPTARPSFDAAMAGGSEIIVYPDPV
jgi:hypothetical protein